MKVTGFSSFGIFVLLAVSLVFACNELVNCSFSDEKSGSSDVPVPKVNVLPPSLPSLSSEGAPCNAELPMVQAPPDVLLPLEDWFKIFHFCTADTLRPSLQVCHSWENIITSNYMLTKLCMLGVEDEANFDRLLLLLKQRSREEQKVLLQRFYDEKLVSQKVLMDLIVRLFMVDDVFSIVAELLRNPSIPMSKLFQENCRFLSVDEVLEHPQRVKAIILELTPELLDDVFKDLTPTNFRLWLSLPPIVKQLMDKATEANPALALRIYRRLGGAVRLPAEEFPTLSCIEPLLPVFFLLPSNEENGERIFFSYRLYSQLTKLQSSEEVMPKEMANKILDILSLVEINEQSMKLLVPCLCPSFLKGWKERETALGKPIIDQFLNISQQFETLNKGISYGMALMSTDFSVIQRAIKSLTEIDSVPFFVYRRLIVRFFVWMTPSVGYDESKVPFSGIEYSPCFMEDLCVLAICCPKEVHAFLKCLNPKHRSSLVSYNTVLTSRLFSLFKENGLDCDVLSTTPSSP